MLFHPPKSILSLEVGMYREMTQKFFIFFVDTEEYDDTVEKTWIQYGMIQ